MEKEKEKRQQDLNELKCLICSQEFSVASKEPAENSGALKEQWKNAKKCMAHFAYSASYSIHFSHSFYLLQ